MDIYAGANHITPGGVLRLCRIAEEVGVDALSVLTPMFVSQTQEEVYAFYRTVTEGTSLPVVVYNNKPKTNVTVEPATVVRLSELPGVVAIKDSTGEMTTRRNTCGSPGATRIFPC
jgi:4-hydroxy-tetrahydrodipicolinate synthase